MAQIPYSYTVELPDDGKYGEKVCLLGKLVCKSKGCGSGKEWKTGSVLKSKFRSMIRSSKWSLGGQNTLARIPKMEPWMVFVHRPMIQLRISFKKKSRIQIRISNEVKSWIRLRIKGLQIRNPGKSSVCLMLMSLCLYWRIRASQKVVVASWATWLDRKRRGKVEPGTASFPGCTRRGNRDRIHEEAQSTYCITVNCMSPRRNWDTPTPYPTNACVPLPLNQKRRGTLACGWGSGEVSIRTTGEEA